MDGTVLVHYGKLGMKWGRRMGPKNVGNNHHNQMNQEEAKRLKDFSKNTNDLTKSGAGFLKGTQTIVRAVDKNKPQPVQKKKNLSHLTNKQLQEQVTRLNLERQYADLTREPQVKTGKMNVDTALEIGGGVLTAVGSAVSIAVAIKALRG